MDLRNSWLEIYRSIGIKPDKGYFAINLNQDVGLLFRRGPREIEFVNTPRLGIQDEENVSLKFKKDKITLEAEFFYTLIEVKRNFENPGELQKARDICSELFAILALLYGPGIVEKKVFGGFQFTSLGGRHEGPYCLLYETHVPETDFMNSLPKAFKNMQFHTERSKLEIALRWYQRGLDSDQPIDQLLYFWVALEALTMTTTDIKEIPKALKYILTSTGEKVIKEKLRIGRIYGCRCDIVHNGLADFDLEYLRILKDIVEEVMRFKLGIASKGLLQKYLE